MKDRGERRKKEREEFEIKVNELLDLYEKIGEEDMRNMEIGSELIRDTTDADIANDIDGEAFDWIWVVRVCQNVKVVKVEIDIIK